MSSTIEKTAAGWFRMNVRTVLNDCDVTITELAELAGTSRSGMSRILAGVEGVTIERAERIAKALDLPLSDLLSREFEISA